MYYIVYTLKYQVNICMADKSYVKLKAGKMERNNKFIREQKKFLTAMMTDRPLEITNSSTKCINRIVNRMRPQNKQSFQWAENTKILSTPTIKHPNTNMLVIISLVGCHFFLLFRLLFMFAFNVCSCIWWCLGC